MRFHGLDLADLESTSPEEVEAFLRSSFVHLESTSTSGAEDGGDDRIHGSRLPYPTSTYVFLLTNRPDMLKRHFVHMSALHAVPSDSGPFEQLTSLTMLHHYVCTRDEGGIAHAIRGSQALGITKDQINEVLAIAFVHAGSAGLHSAYDAAFDYLQRYPEPNKAVSWPVGWAPDPNALRSGLDFSTPSLSSDERLMLRNWYVRTVGEVPESVEFLATYNPHYLKAHQGKLEGALRGALPKQMLPYLMLHHNANRGCREGIREAALWGKNWGIGKNMIINAVTLSGYTAGVDGLYAAAQALSGLLESWE